MATKPAAKDRTDEQNRLIARLAFELSTGQQGLAKQTAEEFEATLPPEK